MTYHLTNGYTHGASSRTDYAPPRASCFSLAIPAETS